MAEQKTTEQYQVLDSTGRASLKEAELTQSGVVEMIDHLTYANYKHNRKLSPEITPEQWAKYGGFPKGSVEKMEVKFQKEEV